LARLRREIVGGNRPRAGLQGRVGERGEPGWGEFYDVFSSAETPGLAAFDVRWSLNSGTKPDIAGLPRRAKGLNRSRGKSL
jgi:hypothetical protein